jgi:DNA-binding response OmpR family regulator
MTRVLVVDDDPDILQLVEWRLGVAGYDVVTERDGDSALVAVRESSPDLVLVDWMMPRRTGIEVCQAVRDDPSTARIPIILLTARAQEADVQRGFAAGADDYIVKPFSPRELLSRVAAVLERSH